MKGVGGARVSAADFEPVKSVHSLYSFIFFFHFRVSLILNQIKQVDPDTLRYNRIMLI